MTLVLFHSPALVNGPPLAADHLVWLAAGVDQTKVIRQLIDDLHVGDGELWVEDGILCQAFDNINFNRFPSPGASAYPKPRKIAFFAASDTLAHTLSPIIRRLTTTDDPEPAVRTFYRTRPDERARQGFEQAGLNAEPFRFQTLIRYRPDLLVLANDWTADAQLMIALGRLLGWQTICLQESVIDLADQRVGRLLYADYVFVQGAVAVKQVRRPLVFLTGNPRYEQLTPQTTGHTAPHFLINCNFTYGVHEDQRENWLRPIVDTLERLNASYTIAQHPRDTGDLSAYRHVVRTNAGIIQQIIREADCIISRFSSVIHEGILQGKRALYFNPHGERVGYDYGIDQQTLFYAETEQELEKRLTTILSTDPSVPADGSDYALLNLNHGIHQASENCAWLLRNFTAHRRGGRPISLIRATYDAFKFRW